MGWGAESSGSISPNQTKRMEKKELEIPAQPCSRRTMNRPRKRIRHGNVLRKPLTVPFQLCVRPKAVCGITLPSKRLTVEEGSVSSSSFARGMMTCPMAKTARALPRYCSDQGGTGDSRPGGIGAMDVASSHRSKYLIVTARRVVRPADQKCHANSRSGDGRQHPPIDLPDLPFRSHRRSLRNT